MPPFDLPSELLEMITGKLLGDGNMIHDGNKATRLRFTHASKDRGWCLHCYQQLSKYMKLSPPKYRRVPDPRVKAGYTECYYVQSFTWPKLEQIKRDWYVNGKKRIPFEYIIHALTPLCLAWWYQDDGHLKKKKDGTVQKIILSTESFTTDERSFLRQQIKKEYKIEFSIDRLNRLVIYDQPAILYFLSLVRPHLSSAMRRKDSSYYRLNKNEFPLQQRTTIYLPVNIHIDKPTKQIHQMLRCLPVINDLMDEEIRFQHFYRSKNRFSEKPKRKGYQIILHQEDLIQITKLQRRTGLQKSECVELCYHFLSKNGRLL